VAATDTDTDTGSGGLSPPIPIPAGSLSASALRVSDLADDETGFVGGAWMVSVNRGSLARLVGPWQEILKARRPKLLRDLLGGIA